MMNKIGLFFSNGTTNGPGKVANNILSGLHLLNIDVKINEFCSVNGCLQMVPEYYDKLPDETLVGPNLWMEPSSRDLRFRHHVVPSLWVQNYYRSFPTLNHVTIDIWPVGINTDLFNTNKEITQDCFIYFKNRSFDDLNHLKNILTSNNLTFSVLEYGHYQEINLLDICAKSKFCILLTNTESQGIAYMEILSCNVPCLVWNRFEWAWKHYRIPASSVPYFDNQCGLVSNHFDLNVLNSFLNNLDQYHPRDYILDNHTLIKGANSYLDILEKYA